LTGWTVGVVARWKRSVPLGILLGALVGFVLSSVAALGQPDQYWTIVLPGMLVGVLAGIACHRGRTAAALACCLLAVAIPSRAQQPATASPLSAIQPLVGKWEGTSEGQPGIGQVTREYRSMLRDRFIEEINRSVYPAQEKNPKGEIHEHRSVFSYDRARKTIVFRQFHVEGFVNQYVMEPPATPGVLVFVTEAIENIPKGYRARETYTFINANEVEELFEMAEPGKDFQMYSKARLKRLP
ncbi:MAG TPA: hypothetical protein VEA16_05995, partial [Vicinamibacterales bacterium]|nr:hypothetical protein [Vicinamibacterales bacterium]